MKNLIRMIVESVNPKKEYQPCTPLTVKIDMQVEALKRYLADQDKKVGRV